MAVFATICAAKLPTLITTNSLPVVAAHYPPYRDAIVAAVNATFNPPVGKALYTAEFATYLHPCGASHNPAIRQTECATHAEPHLPTECAA